MAGKGSKSRRWRRENGTINQTCANFGLHPEDVRGKHRYQTVCVRKGASFSCVSRHHTLHGTNMRVGC